MSVNGNDIMKRLFKLGKTYGFHRSVKTLLPRNSFECSDVFDIAHVNDNFRKQDFSYGYGILKESFLTPYV
jgi:hypothetical protein